MPCGSICPASDALCIAGFKQASACQPPTREIRCIGSGIVDSVEQDLYIMYTYIIIGIFRRLGSFFLRKLGPNFQNTGLEIEPRFPAKPLCRKSAPNLGRAWGGLNLRPFGCKPVCLQLGHVRVASTAIHLHLLHGHRPRPRPDRSQNPNSKRAVWILDFGSWILDFGSWILDFGSV